MTRVVQRRSSARLQNNNNTNNNTNNNINLSVIKSSTNGNLCSKQNELSNTTKLGEFVHNQNYSKVFYSNDQILRRNISTSNALGATYNNQSICDKERLTTVIVVEELDCLRNSETENERNLNSNSYGNSEGSSTPNSSLSSISSNSLLSNGYSLSPTRIHQIYKNSNVSLNAFHDNNDSLTVIRQNSNNIYECNSPTSVSSDLTIHCYDKTYTENSNSSILTYNILTQSQNIVNENIVNNNNNNTVIVGGGCVDSTMSMSSTFLNNNNCLLTNNNSFDYRPQYVSATTPSAHFDSNENEMNNCGSGTYANYYQASLFLIIKKNFY